MRNTTGTFLAKDRTNEKHEFFTVLYDTGKKDKSGSHIWKAQCDCGSFFEVSSGRINRIKSCGCKRKTKSGRNNYENLKGKVVRDIIVLEKTEKHSNGYVVWRSKCLLCGETKDVPSYYFMREHVSCECEEWQNKYGGLIGRKPLPDYQSHVNIAYNHYMKSAKERNLEFRLTKAEFRELVEQNCFYCGAEPQVRYTSKNLHGEYAWNGIDRVDNAIGYLKDNCVPCCSMCNFAKSTHTKEEFLNWIERVYKHSLNKGGGVK